MRGSHALAIVLCAAGALQAAQAQEIGFKGLLLGAPRAEMMQRFPFLNCFVIPDNHRALGEEMCSARGLNITQEAKSYGGREAWNLSFILIHGQVGSFTVKFRPGDYEVIRNAAAEGYGPGTETSRQMVSRAGASITSREWRHTGANGTISIYEYGTRIDQGDATGESFDLDQYRRQLSDPKKGSKDL